MSQLESTKLSIEGLLTGQHVVDNGTELLGDQGARDRFAFAARHDRYAGYRADDVGHVVRSVGGDRVAAAYLQLVSRPGPLNYNELLQGTKYRVDTVPDSTVAGGRRWQVIDVPVRDHTTPNLGVLGTGCRRAQ